MTGFNMMRLLIGCAVLLSLSALGEEATNKVETVVPSAEVVKSFITSLKLTPDGKETVELVVNARKAVLPKRVMEIYKQKGTLPFSISVELSKIITKDAGTETQSIFDGSATIVVVDKDGSVVSQKTEDLSALCPSWTGAGGYLGEVTKAGTYKAYVWLVYEKKTFGKVLDLELK